MMRGAARAAVRTAALVGVLAYPGFAVADGTAVTVSASILPRATLAVLEQPAFITITPLDIARGYVDVPQTTRVAVKNNTPGYMLVFAGAADFIRQVRVSGLGTDLQMGAAGGGWTRSTPGRGMNHTMLDMGFRFELAASARQGVYPWPIQLSVVPL